VASYKHRREIVHSRVSYYPSSHEAFVFEALVQLFPYAFARFTVVGGGHDAVLLDTGTVAEEEAQFPFESDASPSRRSILGPLR
jgi:hypothetical protein